jgi:hypothetical protein
MTPEAYITMVVSYKSKLITTLETGQLGKTSIAREH